MERISAKKEQHIRRARRTRAKVLGTAAVPRLTVFRSNRHLWAQLVDDAAGRTIASASDLKRGAGKRAKARSRSERAREVGATIARQAATLGIQAVRFDRGPYQYHGLVKALAEGAREAGLKF